MTRPLAVIGFSFFLTIVLLVEIDSVRLTMYLCCFAAAFFVCSLVVKRLRKSAAYSAASLSVAAACVLLVFSTLFSYRPALALASDSVKVRAEVVGLPVYNGEKFHYTLRTLSVGSSNKSERLRLSTSFNLHAEPYDIVEFTGKVYVLGGENESIRKKFRSGGVYLGAYTFSDISVERTDKKPLYYHILMLRKSIEKSVKQNLPGEEGNVICAMLLGSTHKLSAETYNAFKVSGVSHLFAVSGLHLSVWAYSVFKLLKKLKCPRRIAAAVTMLFVLFFTALTGFSNSCVRAAVMMLIMLLGVFMSEDSDPINSLGAAMLIICFFDPFSASNAGLILSFTATLGIVLCQRFISRKITPRSLGKSLPARLLRYFIGVLSVSIAALIFTLPSCVHYFGGISLVAPVTNMLVMFPAYIAMLAGGFIPLTAAVSPICSLLSFVAGLAAKYTINVTRLLSEIPFAFASAQENYIMLWLAVTILALAAALLLRFSYKRMLRFTAAVSATVLIVGTISIGIINRGVTKITAVDVGNGLAVLVTKGENSMLIGCSGDYYAFDNISESLDAECVCSIDLLVLLREEDVESECLTLLLERFEVGEIISPSLPDTAVDAAKASINIMNEASGELCRGVSFTYISRESLHCVCINADSTEIVIAAEPSDSYELLSDEQRCGDILLCRAAVPWRLSAENFGYVIVSDSRKSTAEKLLADDPKCEKSAATCNYGSVRIRSIGQSRYSVVRA